MLRSAAALRPEKGTERCSTDNPTDQARSAAAAPSTAPLLARQISPENANGLRLFWG